MSTTAIIAVGSIAATVLAVSVVYVSIKSLLKRARVAKRNKRDAGVSRLEAILETRLEVEPPSTKVSMYSDSIAKKGQFPRAKVNALVFVGFISSHCTFELLSSY